MALAVCALFDAAGERLIRGLWERMEDAGIGSLASHTHGHHHPHLSFAVLREWEFDSVYGTLGRLAHGPDFSANVQGTVVFPRGRVALAVAVPVAVARRQDRVASALTSTGAQLHKHYRPSSWIPHVSVATRTPGPLLPVAVNAISDVLPATLQANRAALIDTASGEIWPLPGIPRKAPAATRTTRHQHGLADRYRSLWRPPRVSAKRLVGLPGCPGAARPFGRVEPSGGASSSTRRG